MPRRAFSQASFRSPRTNMRPSWPFGRKAPRLPDSTASRRTAHPVRPIPIRLQGLRAAPNGGSALVPDVLSCRRLCGYEFELRHPRSGLRVAVTVTIVNVGVSRGIKRLARALFGPEQIPDVLEVLGWYDDVQADDVHRAGLTLSKGDMNALLDLVAAAVDDFRDVLMWASLPEPTPEEREAARARAAELNPAIPRDTAPSPGGQVRGQRRGADRAQQ
jgi:hypothetical protein